MSDETTHEVDFPGFDMSTTGDVVIHGDDSATKFIVKSSNRVDPR